MGNTGRSRETRAPPGFNSGACARYVAQIGARTSNGPKVRNRRVHLSAPSKRCSSWAPMASSERDPPRAPVRRGRRAAAPCWRPLGAVTRCTPSFAMARRTGRCRTPERFKRQAAKYVSKDCHNPRALSGSERCLPRGRLNRGNVGGSRLPEYRASAGATRCSESDSIGAVHG